MEQLTVSRKKWLRGSGPHSAMFRNGSGQYCVLGRYAAAKGVPDRSLTRVGDLGAIDDTEAWPESLYDRETGTTYLAHEIMRTNDDVDLDDTQRETLLVELFADANIALTFVD